MHDPTRFGDFLLLKKLSEDPLGETYRACRMNGNSVGEFVFLRTFNLAETPAAELVQQLRATNPRIQASGLVYAGEGGAVSGVAFAAYPYSTGWNIPQFIATATSGFSDLEQDHGLLIAERLALGLATVHQTDPAVARPSHGFLVPQSVHLSSEGDIELMGIETGAYLASRVARGEMKELLPYLSPEVRGGQTPTPADDVYSLGALLWQLLTTQVPPLDSTHITTALASARLASGEMLPAGLAEILQSSLAAPHGRVANATLWHNKLTEWMGRNEIKTTHFDLAFFIHELFRKQIQAEQDEIEREKKLDLSPQPFAPAPVAEEPEMSDVILRPDLSGMVQRPSAGTMSPEAVEASPAASASAGKSKGLLFGGIVALILLAAVSAWFVFRGGTAAPAPPPVSPAPPPAVAEVPSESLQVAQLELERLVSEQGAASDQLADEFEESIRSLREQLEAAEAAERETMAQLAAASSEPSDEAAAGAAAPDTASVQEDSPSPESTSGGEATVPASPPLAPAPASPAVIQPVESTPAPTELSATTTELSTGESPDESNASAPAQVTPPSVPPPPPPPPPQTVNVTPPRRLTMPDPRYPARARQQRKEATILIKVLVSAQGKVLDAEPVLDKGDPHDFYKEALRSARAAEFEPARSNGTAIEMWTTVVITFKLKK